MQIPFGTDGSPVALSYGPCGHGTPAAFLNEVPGSTNRPLRRLRVSVRRSPHQVCAALLSVVALVAITVYYFRACHGWAKRGAMQRRLAGRGFSPGEDPMLSAILDMCLDMEEENGTAHPQPRVQTTTGPADDLLPLESEQGLPKGRAYPYPWEWMAPPSNSSPPVPQVYPVPHQQGDYGSQRGAVTTSKTTSPQTEQQSLSSRHFSISPPCCEGVQSLEVGEGISFTFSGVRSTSTSPQNSISPGLSANLFSRSFPGPASGVQNPQFLSPGDPSTHQQPLFPINRPKSGSPYSPNLATSQGKRHIALVYPSGTPSPDDFSKRRKMAVPTVEVTNKSTVSLSGPTAPRMVLLESKIGQGHRSEGDDADPLLRAIQAVPLQWLPPPLEHSAPGAASKSEVTDSAVSSSSPKETGNVGLSASVPGEQPSPKPSEEPQCLYSACADRATAASSEAASEDSPSQAGSSVQGPDAHHPFYRLPALEAGAHLEVFSVKNAFKLNRNLRGCDLLLQYMRASLLKERLSEGEANGMIRISEGLVSHIYHFQRTSVAKFSPSLAVAILGRRYLMLDALTCAVQVLGPAMVASEWWQKLVSVIPSHAVFFPIIYKDERARKYAKLATRLSSAIESLKLGARPGPGETVALKRELLCNNACHPEFKRAPYEPWRIDDRQSRADHKR